MHADSTEFLLCYAHTTVWYPALKCESNQRRNMWYEEYNLDERSQTQDLGLEPM